jgi:hypothetical protein
MMEKEVPSFSAGVVLQLEEQRRYQVEGLPDCRKVFQQRDHIIVSLESMESHPGKGILSAEGVAVIGLVHMPKEGDVQPYHDLPLPFKLMKI